MASERKAFRIGTRGSLLAVAQAEGIRRRLARLHPGLKFRLVKVRTTGDEFQGVELFKKNNIGVFTNKIERKLLSGQIDIAVHSLKDLPVDLPRGLVLGAFPRRGDARDALISRKRHTLADLPRGSSIGTGSPRRKRQIALARPDLQVLDIRGNLDTRVGKVLKARSFDAIVVANAGLERLGKYRRQASPIPIAQLLPAVGQAALGIEVRKNDKEALRVVARLTHEPTKKAVTVERAFLKALHGGCRVPVGVDCRLVGGNIRMKASVFSTKNRDFVSGQFSCPSALAVRTGQALAKRLLKKGASRFLREARS